MIDNSFVLDLIGDSHWHIFYFFFIFIKKISIITSDSKFKKEENQKRSLNAVKCRESMISLSEKMKQLQTHEVATKNKGKEKATTKVLDKREYCKIAAEVSFEFENLSRRYNKDLLLDTSNVVNSQKTWEIISLFCDYLFGRRKKSKIMNCVSLSWIEC